MVKKVAIVPAGVIAAFLLIAAGFCPLLAASVVALPSLPEGVLPNSEVVTNIALDVNVDRLESLTFSIGLVASASNSLSVAVGVSQGDVLALEEADFEWGYDCGKWFYADTATGGVEEWTASATGRVERTLAISHRDFKPHWNTIRVAKRGLGDMNVEASCQIQNKKFNITIR